MSEDYRGECLCGAVRYEIEGAAFRAMYLCHCSRCRKETGTIHGANVFLAAGTLSFERGEDHLTFYQVPGARHSRQFCKTCGSPMPRQHGSTIILPAGSLDEDSMLHPTAHLFCDSGSSWEDEAPSAPRFDQLPPPENG